jgi:hypothetical protein
MFNDAEANSKSLVFVWCSTSIPDNSAHEKPILPIQKMSKKRKYFIDFSS